jgi:hypothetical protein
VSTLGPKLAAPEINVASRAVLVQAKIKLQAGFSVHAEIKPIDDSAGAPIERQCPSYHSDAIIRINADQSEVRDGSSLQWSDDTLKPVPHAAGSGAQMPHAVVIAPDPVCSIITSSQFSSATICNFRREARRVGGGRRQKWWRTRATRIEHSAAECQKYEKFFHAQDDVWSNVKVGHDEVGRELCLSSVIRSEKQTAIRDKLLVGSGALPDIIRENAP